MQVLFLGLEFIQFKDKGRGYFASYYNIFELVHFVMFVIYFIARLDDMDSTIPPHTETPTDRSVELQAFFSILNILIIVTGTIKIFYYIRVYEGLGWIVELIAQCMADMATFTSFFVFLIVVFGILYFAAGVNCVEQ